MGDQDWTIGHLLGDISISQYQANPRVGHLEAVYHILAYMKKHTDMGRIVYDPKDIPVNEDALASNAD
jgi:hypothetical protein